MRWVSAASVFLAVLLCGCADDAPASPGVESGDAVAVGAELFEQRVVGSKPGCVTCHSLEPDVTLVGPSLAGLAERAGQRVAGQSALEYVKASITDPDSHVVDGFRTGQMVGGWTDELSEAQIDSLVDYLLGL